jgi:hypothetical protein
MRLVAVFGPVRGTKRPDVALVGLWLLKSLRDSRDTRFGFAHLSPLKRGEDEGEGLESHAAIAVGRPSPSPSPYRGRGDPHVGS